MNTTIKAGIIINRLRKLERQWEFWVKFRAARYAGSWQQEQADKWCEKFGPVIVALRKEVAA